MTTSPTPSAAGPPASAPPWPDTTRKRIRPVSRPTQTDAPRRAVVLPAAALSTPGASASIVNPAGITAGPDGALWFTNNGNGAGTTIGRITPPAPQTITFTSTPPASRRSPVPTRVSHGDVRTPGHLHHRRPQHSGVLDLGVDRDVQPRRQLGHRRQSGRRRRLAASAAGSAGDHGAEGDPGSGVGRGSQALPHPRAACTTVTITGYNLSGTSQSGIQREASQYGLLGSEATWSGPVRRLLRLGAAALPADRGGTPVASEATRTAPRTGDLRVLPPRQYRANSCR
jgi:hypothetical protein